LKLKLSEVPIGLEKRGVPLIMAPGTGEPLRVGLRHVLLGSAGHAVMVLSRKKTERGGGGVEIHATVGKGQTGRQQAAGPLFE
jgi:hypothetical protein